MGELAAVAAAARLREEDVPRGTPEEVAEAAIALHGYMDERVRVGPRAVRPEWLPHYVDSRLAGAA